MKISNFNHKILKFIIISIKFKFKFSILISKLSSSHIIGKLNFQKDSVIFFKRFLIKKISKNKKSHPLKISIPSFIFNLFKSAVARILQKNSYAVSGLQKFWELKEWPSGDNRPHLLHLKNLDTNSNIYGIMTGKIEQASYIIKIIKSIHSSIHRFIIYLTYSK